MVCIVGSTPRDGPGWYAPGTTETVPLCSGYIGIRFHPFPIGHPRKTTNWDDVQLMVKPQKASKEQRILLMIRKGWLRSIA